MQAERNGRPNCVHSEYTFSEDQIGYAVSTQLPDKKLLSEKLQRAIVIVKEHYANAANNWSLEVWNSKITGKCVIL